MKSILIGISGAALAVAGLIAQAKINPTDPQPTCNMCPGHYIPLAELQAYTKKAIDEKLLDQQVRDIDIGKAHVGIGMVHRGKLDKPAPDSVAEHDQVSEVYHIIDGTATLVTGADIVDLKPRPADDRAVRLLNGPGGNGASIRNGVKERFDPQTIPGDEQLLSAFVPHGEREHAAKFVHT